jgi:hypothetical protein
VRQANPIEQIIGGFMGGFFVAGIIGYAIDNVIETMFEAFQQVVPLILVLSVVYAVCSFLLGIKEAYYAGVFFSLGIISAGFLLNDFVTIVSGLIPIIVIVYLFLKK